MAVDPVTLAIAASIVTVLAFVYLILFGQRSLADLIARWQKNRKRKGKGGDLAQAELEFSRQEFAKATASLDKTGTLPDQDKRSRADALLLLAEAEAYSGNAEKAKEHSEEVLSLLGGPGDILVGHLT